MLTFVVAVTEEVVSFVELVIARLAVIAMREDSAAEVGAMEFDEHWVRDFVAIGHFVAVDAFAVVVAVIVAAG